MGPIPTWHSSAAEAVAVEPEPKLDTKKTEDADSTREITRPRPLQQILRGPIDFKRPKQPPADRVSGDRPLQRIAKALTGQRPKAEEAATKTSTPDPKPADGHSKDNTDSKDNKDSKDSKDSAA